MPCLIFFLSHSKRDVHAAARLARPLVQRQDHSTPIHIPSFWTLFLHHTYSMRVILVLDPQPAVTQPVSRQRPGPLSVRAKRRNAKQGTAFKTANEKNGLWIVRKHTPRAFGGALPYLMPSMPWSVPCRPPPDRSSLNLPLRNNQFWERGGSHDPPRLTICSFPASVFASCSDGQICLPASAGNVEHTTYVIYARSNGGAAHACLAGFDRAQSGCCSASGMRTAARAGRSRNLN